MAIKNTYVSSDFLSMFIDSINVYDCRLSGVFITKLKTQQGQSETRARSYLLFHVSVEIFFVSLFAS